MIRILHVDDSALDLELIDMQLKRLSNDIEILKAESGEDALLLLEEEEPDCILCDIQMREMDGLELLKSLRGMNNDLPFVFLTELDNDSLVNEAKRLGADDYFTKEIDFNRYEPILVKLREKIRERKSDQQRKLS